MEYRGLVGDSGRLWAEIKHPRILTFNPGHEMIPETIGRQPYTPPPIVRRMMHDLGLLPAWLTDNKDDLLFCPEDTCLLPESHPLKPRAQLLSRHNKTEYPLSSYVWDMWGQSPVWRDSIIKQHPDLAVVSAPPYSQELYQRSHRQEAALCLQSIGHERLAAHWFTSVEDFLEKQSQLFPTATPLLAKFPSTSSGRGLVWLTPTPTKKEINTLRKALLRTGTFSVEPVLDIRQDWAAEFYSDGKGKLYFIGLSRFDTNRHGAYLGNRIASQRDLTQELIDTVGTAPYETAIRSLQQYLQKRFGSLYTGYIGVDMAVHMADDQPRLHPCIEINVRYTMGVAAILLYQLWVQEGEIGRFEVKSFPSEGKAKEWNEIMQKRYPLHIIENKIRYGYLPLTFPDPTSRFLSYLFVTPERDKAVNPLSE